VVELIVEFPARSQSLGSLREAAYRLISRASCQLDSLDDVHVCRLVPKSPKEDLNELRCHFLDLVTDENLREKMAAQTSKTRDVILALAFGSLAAAEERPE
jgi:His-Xaa-Ser system protein HxsD